MNIKNFFKKITPLALGVFIISLAFFAGFYVNAKTTGFGNVGVTYTTGKTKSSDVDLSSLLKAWDLLQEKYLPTGVASTTSVGDKDRVYGAIKGLADSLGDPYTTFFTPEEAKSFTSDLSGSLEGIGAVLSLKEDVITVVSVIKDSPAEKKGLLQGDKIVKVDGTETRGFSVEKAVSMIRGKKGTNVTLSIFRQGRSDIFNITITRDTITTPVVETQKYAGGVFVIKVSGFTSNAPELFRNALKEFTTSRYGHLAIDMRNNTGGYLEAAVDMASWFLKVGDVIVTEDYGGKQDPVVFRSKGYRLFGDDMKVVILVNESSASATEIFAGALKDHGKAILVGAKTYGKGSVQELIPITNDSLLKVTVARWLTPNGISISLNGILPDYDVKYTEDDFKAKKDPQLDKALELARSIK